MDSGENIPVVVEDELTGIEFEARGIFQEVEHPLIGKSVVVGPPWRFDGERHGAERPAPLLGQHNDFVLREVLGLSESEVERLEEAGALR